MSETVTVEVSPAEPIRVGGTVAGLIRVTSERRLEVKRAVVRARWQTGGVVEVQGGVGEETLLPTFVVEPNLPYEATFVVSIPDGPISLRGELITVTWSVDAELNASWTVNPRGSAEIEVLAEAREAPVELGYRAAAEREPTALTISRSEEPATGWKAGLVRGATFLAGPAFVAGLAVAPVPLHALAVAALACTYIEYMLIRSTIDEWRKRREFGVLRLAVEPAVIHRGESVRVRAELVAARDLEIDGCDAWLDCEEHVLQASNQPSAARAHVIHVGHRTLASSRALERGKPETIEGSLYVPEHALPTLELPNTTIRWYAAAQVQVGGVFVAQRVDIDVLP